MVWASVSDTNVSESTSVLPSRSMVSDSLPLKKRVAPLASNRKPIAVSRMRTALCVALIGVKPLPGAMNRA